MTSDHCISSNNSFKSLLNAKIFNMFFNNVAVVRRTVVLFQCLLQGENWKEPSSSTISIEASFNGDSNEENLNVNKTCCQ